jgi:tetratricopeptide (TPR) repeat protein
MHRRLSLFCASLLLLLLLLPCACGLAASPGDGKIPVTTASEEARKEFLAGLALSDNLQLTSSLSHFDRAIALDSNFATAYLNRANASATAKEFFWYLGKAAKVASGASEGERLQIGATEAAAAGQAQKQREILEKLVGMYPADERVRFALGAYYFGQQEYAAAIAQYTRALESAPDFPPVYNILGYAYRQIENYPEAERVFKRYTELIPTNPNPYDSYAELLLKVGRFDESISLYKKALSLDPSFVASYSGLAMNYMQKGEPKEALAAAEKIGTLARNDGERRLSLFVTAVIRSDAREWGKALRALDEEYAIAKKNNDAGSMAADLAASGTILLEAGRLDDAARSFTASLERNEASGAPEDVKKNARLFHHFNLATVAIARKDMKSAREEAELFRAGVALTRNPNQSRLTHELAGRIALAEKDYATAVAELGQANLQDPYNQYRLGLAHAGAGDTGKSKAWFEKAAHLNGLPGLNMAFVRQKAAEASKN